MTDTKPSTNPVTWFEIASANPATASRFYGELFGWSCSQDEFGADYQLVRTGSERGIGGGLFNTKGEMPNYAVFFVEVADVGDICRRAEALGGKVLVPATDAADGLVFAHLLDADGNHIGVFTPPAS